jgi:hypothetical protein
MRNDEAKETMKTDYPAEVKGILREDAETDNRTRLAGFEDRSVGVPQARKQATSAHLR